MSGSSWSNRQADHAESVRKDLADADHSRNAPVFGLLVEPVLDGRVYPKMKFLGHSLLFVSVRGHAPSFMVSVSILLGSLTFGDAHSFGTKHGWRERSERKAEGRNQREGTG